MCWDNLKKRWNPLKPIILLKLNFLLSDCNINITFEDKYSIILIKDNQRAVST